MGVSFASVGELVNSVSTWNPQRDDPDRSFRYVDLSAVDQDTKEIIGVREIPCSEAPSRARQIIRERDVLVSTVRPNLNAVALVGADLDGATASTGFCVLRPYSNKLDAGYLFHWVRSPKFVDEMVRRATGASYPAVSDRVIRDSKLPLPSISEQRRIAEILNKADALCARRRAAVVLLDDLLRSVFIDIFGISEQTPVTIGDNLKSHKRGWRWELLTQVARLATGHTPDRSRPDYWNGHIPWISLTEIRRLDGKVAEDTRDKVTQAGIDNSSAVLLPAGTVCFSRTASIGFVTVMNKEMSTSQDFVNWVCGPRLEPIYLMHALLTSRARLRALSTGSTHKTIYFPTVEQFRVLVPPIELQRTFVQNVAVIDRLKARYLAASLAAEDLFVSLQQRAFRGEL